MMQHRSILAVPFAALLLASCGQRAALESPTKASPPPTPHGAQAPPDAEELLKPGTLAVPERSVELRKRSEEREDDPFDLPPE
jgi:hypothetical protein